MKAFLALALAHTAMAMPAIVLNACPIPAKYVTSASGNVACAGPATGYKVYGYCSVPQIGVLGNGWTTEAATQQAAIVGTGAPVRAELTTTNAATVFTLGTDQPAMGAATTPSGCYIIADTLDWSLEAAGVMAGAISPNCDQQGTEVAGTVATDAPTSRSARGVMVECDTTNNFYPSAGLSGSAPCVKGHAAGTGAYTVAEGAYFTTGRGQYVSGAETTAATIPFFSTLNSANTVAAESLTCVLSCDLSALTNVYTNGAWHSNVWAMGDGNLGNGRMRPNHPLRASQLTIGCVSTGRGRTWTIDCASSTTTDATATTTYAGECGTADGSTSSARVNTQDLTGLPTEQTAAADAIEGYATAASTQNPAIFTTTGDAWFNARSWNANPFQALVNGNVQRIDVTGCANQTTAATRGECVQRTLNYWRCKGYNFDGGAQCYANSLAVACPTHEAGFRCPTSSKKGLLGLLGLLGLIPLLLLSLLCFICLCCIPRKKSTGEVHMSTFDPQPAVAAGSIAPATACYAPSIGAVPAPAPIGVF